MKDTEYDDLYRIFILHQLRVYPKPLHLTLEQCKLLLTETAALADYSRKAKGI
jgi:hypothetical protein